MDISIIIPASHEAENLKVLLPLVTDCADRLGLTKEIIVVDEISGDGTELVCQQCGARFIAQQSRGFGNALREGFCCASGDYIMTMDADLSHEPWYIERMWEKRFDAECIIASRYVTGGSARMPAYRYVLSKAFNRVLAWLLSFEIKDMSSNFRMYSRRALLEIQTSGKKFDVLEEILIKIYCKGWRITEVPFSYCPRYCGQSHMRVLKLWRDYLETFFQMWRLRNSIACADYDFRGFYSRIFVQQFWQRQRYSKILRFVGDRRRFLDVGCGSSKIIIDRPDAVALDINLGKLRFLRATNRKLVNADAGRLPFADASFDCVVCSQMIEHSTNMAILDELSRVLKKGGILVLGTPDYDKFSWRLIERLYAFFLSGGYAEEHVMKYSYHSLQGFLKARGLIVVDHAYICDAELIIQAQKV
ncbi:MAG TPA: glycosyltransferase [Candidatus Omnitrophota bacterium]|nr:glycosyltransferase [Candidatus Omnitrophota bacterium]HPT07160.1 glycosyltransferase [Candidatus Omnitrophota bacterium]